MAIRQAASEMGSKLGDESLTVADASVSGWLPSRLVL